MKSKSIFLIIFLVVLIILGLYLKLPKKSTVDLNKFVLKQMSLCQNVPDSNACYKNLAHIFATKYKLKDVLKVFEQNEKEPIFFSKCHTTLHFLGQEEYKATHDTGKALAAGTPICFAGFFHGVLEEYLVESNLIHDTEKLANVLPTLCDSKEDFSIKKNYNECLHGLGHALMFATEGDLPKSLALCDNLPNESDQSWCYSGGFMENSTSSTNPDHPSKFLDKNNPMYPCNILEGKYLNMCYTLQSFYFAEISNYDWKKNEALCLKVPATYQDGCFNAIGQNQVGFTQDLDIMKNNCHLMARQNDRNSCIYGIIGGLGERYDDGVERVLNFCKVIITDQSERANCLARARALAENWASDPAILEKFSQ